MHACSIYIIHMHQLTQIDTPRFRYEILHELITGTVMPTTASVKSGTDNGALALAIKHNSINNLEREESQHLKTDNSHKNGAATGSEQTVQEKSSLMSSTSNTSLSIAQPKVKSLRLSLSKQAERGSSNIPFSNECKQGRPVITTTYKSVLQQVDTNANQIQATIEPSSKKPVVTMLSQLPLDNADTKQGKQHNQYQSTIRRNKPGCSLVSKRKQEALRSSLFECTICKKTYGLRYNLQKHMSKKHPEQSVSHCNIACNEDKCNFTCRFLSQLRHHLQEVHAITMDSENKTFETQEG